MTPQALWFEDIFDALRADTAAIGPKTLAAILWPEKPIEAAARLLADCLNRDRSARFTPEQVTLIIREARKVNSFCTIAFICDDASMTRPTPIDPEDTKAQLQREVIKAAGQFKHLIDRLERMEGK
jgi:hypothetical protein